MQRKKLATKIASILSAAMLVSTTMTAFATDGEVSVAAEQTDVQTIAETADEATSEASEEDAVAGEEIAEGETAAEEESVGTEEAAEENASDDEITLEVATEEAQITVEEAQVLDTYEVTVVSADPENDGNEGEADGDGETGGDDGESGEDAGRDAAALETDGYKKLEGSNIYYKYDSNDGILYFECAKDKTDVLPGSNDEGKNPPSWYESVGINANKSAVQQIIVGYGITEIGASCFRGDWLTGLEYVKLTAVQSIDEWAFFRSPVKKVEFGSVTNIGYNAFCQSKIESVELSSSDTVTIGEEAFDTCTSLTSFAVNGTAATVTVGKSAFNACTSLTSFAVKGTGSLTLNAKSFYGCGNLEVVGNPPEHYTAYNVAYLGTEALSGTQISDVLFSTKSITLESNAFKGVSMNSICYPGTAAEWKAIVDAVEGGVSLDEKWPVKLHCVADNPIGEGYAYCRAGNHNYSMETNDDSTPESETETEHKHSWSAWKTKTPATVFKAEVQERTCKCGKTETRTVGKKLTPTITVNAKKIWLQKGQKTSALKVSGLANGDSVKSYKSSNKKIFTVTNKGVIKAGKKVGTAKLTITLASGKTKVIPIKVQKRQVKTWAINNLPAKVTLKKGATYKLSPVISLITSTHKVTYKTSNKKIATVTSAGKIKGVKKGTAVITVKSGTVTEKVKVTVK